MKTYFSFKEMGENKWMICPNYAEFSDKQISGSYNLLACRISGLSWPQWLRYCRQNGAKLYGKESRYVSAAWEKPNNEFLSWLNKRADEISEKINLKEIEL